MFLMFIDKVLQFCEPLGNCSSLAYCAHSLCADQAFIAFECFSQYSLQLFDVAELLFQSFIVYKC